MSALSFDPWAPAEMQSDSASPAKPANLANPGTDPTHGLAGLAALAAASKSKPKPKLDVQPGTQVAARAPRKWSYPVDDPLRGDWWLAAVVGVFGKSVNVQEDGAAGFAIRLTICRSTWSCKLRHDREQLVSF
jgi:hypothetical protein